jgi:hypothetical protein
METTDKLLADLRMMTSGQMSILEEVVAGLQALRGIVADGLVVRSLPESAPAPLEVPIDGLVVALDGRLLQLQRSLEESLTELTKQMKAQPTSVRGGGAPNQMWVRRASDGEKINPATEETLQELLGANGITKFDYGARTDGNPVYVGKAVNRTADEANSVWNVTRFTYDASARATEVAVREDIAWADRTTGW